MTMEQKVKNTLLNGKDFQTKKGWVIRITADDKVQVFPPRGDGVETTLTHLDRAVKDFCRNADVYEPGVKETQGKPSGVSGTGLGKDTSTNEGFSTPTINTQPKPKGKFTDTSLGKDTSTNEGFANPAVNKRPRTEFGLPNTELGADSSGKPTNWRDKQVEIQEDGRTGKIIDTYESGPDPMEIYRNLQAKRPSKEMLEDIMDPDRWVAKNVFAQMQENSPKRGPGMPGKGKATFGEGNVGGQIGAEEVEACSDGSPVKDKVKKSTRTAQENNDILYGMARALFVSSWASEWERLEEDYEESFIREEAHNLDMDIPVFSGNDLMDLAPPTEDKAFDIAKSVYEQIEKDNGINLETFVPPDESSNFNKADFGHYLMMQALGSGVRWSDSHEDHGLKIPRIEEYETDVMTPLANALYEESGGDENFDKLSTRTAGPKLREKWMQDGGYHREIESESAEELHALVQGFAGEEVDWSPFRPKDPTGDEDKEGQVDPQAQAPQQQNQTQVTQASKKAAYTKKVDIAISEQAAGDWGEMLPGFMAAWKKKIEEKFENVANSNEILLEIHETPNDDHVKIQGFDDEQAAQEDIEEVVSSSYDELSSTYGMDELDESLGLKAKNAQFEDEGSDVKAEDFPLMSALMDAGIEIDHHESDLYFPVTEESTAILENYPQQFKNSTKFKDNISGDTWYDVPFSYTPYFNDEQGHMKAKVTGSWKQAQEGELEAVDEKAKDYFSGYMGEYGRELTKDDGVADKKKAPKAKDKKKAQDATQPPASTPTVQQNPPTPGGAKPPVAPEQKKAPAQQPMQPGVGDAGIQALGWTQEDVQQMTDEQKQKILQVKLTKPGTQQKTQQPPQQKAPAPGAPKAPQQAPQAPQAPGIEQTPPAPSVAAPKAVKGNKRGQALAQPAEQPANPPAQAPAPAEGQPSAPATEAPKTPMPKAPGKPSGTDQPGMPGMDEGGNEQQAFKILQEVQTAPVQAATTNEVVTAKVSMLLQRLITELGMSPEEASKLFGLQRNNFSALFK